MTLSYSMRPQYCYIQNLQRTITLTISNKQEMSYKYILVIERACLTVFWDKYFKRLS